MDRSNQWDRRKARENRHSDQVACPVPTTPLHPEALNYENNSKTQITPLLTNQRHLAFAPPCVVWQAYSKISDRTQRQSAHVATTRKSDFLISLKVEIRFTLGGA